MPQAHFHDKHELYFLGRGGVKYLIGSDIYLLEPGDMIFVPKGAFHQTGWYKNELAERILLVFDDDFAGAEYLPYLNALKKNKLIRIRPDKLYLFKEIFTKIEKEDQQKEPGYREMEQAYLRQLLILIDRYRAAEKGAELSDTYRLIQEAATYISKHYSNDLSLSFLAKKYALSPSRFSKLFKEVTGVGLSAYINMTRITAAEKLLTEQKRSITQVAEECGFNDSNYFAAVFKKLKGITPKKYSMRP